MDRNATRLVLAASILAFAFAQQLGAEELIAISADRLAAWDSYLLRTEQLETELAAFQERIELVETRDGGRRDGDACGCYARPGWKVGVEYLHWGVRRRDVDFAIPTDDIALAVGSGSVQRMGWDRSSGVRGQLARVTRSGWDMGIGYVYFRTSGAAAAQEPVRGNLWATRSHPDRNEEAATAAAFGSFDYHVLDLEVGRPLPVNCSTSLRIFGGLRWANIDQNLRFEYDGWDFANGVVSQPLSFDGFGLRLGFEGVWHVRPCWNVFGRVAGSALYGEFHGRHLETNVAGADTIVDVLDNYDQAVPVLEAAVGVSWSSDWLEIAGGYEIADWINLADRSAFVDSVHEGLYMPSSTDVLLDGFFIRCTASF